ncbi:hypothetical protein QR97_02240 [Streptomyces sp. PBH53]|uniref:hypothetical protein n=1 Tax=Streptomyces sp. PBH53 TaxID=1577075 RepID=UPI000655296A|nr:hypothetical protein [Streptomyces sp. PBH53]AKN68777.1 hypothetical protein QR97_02240 [Streptomyces sp. PBH53]
MKIPESLARLTAARGHRDLSDLARQNVGVIGSPTTVQERIAAVRRLRILVEQIVDLVVLEAALSGASWEEITQALNRRDAETVQGEYEDAVADWRAAPASAYADVQDDARALDEWYRRHRDDGDPATENPVSHLLQAD